MLGPCGEANRTSSRCVIRLDAGRFDEELGRIHKTMNVVAVAFLKDVCLSLKVKLAAFDAVGRWIQDWIPTANAGQFAKLFRLVKVLGAAMHDRLHIRPRRWHQDGFRVTRRQRVNLPSCRSVLLHADISSPTILVIQTDVHDDK